MTMKGNSGENLGILLINIFLWKCYRMIFKFQMFQTQHFFLFISKENSSKWIKSFSKYKPFKWNFESLIALRPTLLISCLGHYRGLTKCSENKSKIKIAVFNLPTSCTNRLALGTRKTQTERFNNFLPSILQNVNLQHKHKIIKCGIK